MVVSLALKFDGNVATVLQRTDFTCSLGSLGWCLSSIGIDAEQAELEAICVPGLVSEHDGLLDGRGTAIARLLRDRWGLAADNWCPISFDEVAARAGRQPLMIGGANWSEGVGHWVAVRRAEGERLILANPGGTGPRFGQQVLDRQDFAARAPFAAVWIDVGDDGAATVDAPAAPADTILGGNAFRVAGTDGAGVTLRSQPTTSGARVGGLAEDATADGAEHAWRQVTDPLGSRGWVADEFLVAADSGFRVANTGGQGVTLRSGPSASAARVKGLAEGATVSGGEHAWRYVAAAGGERGWVADEFLSRPSDGEAAEVWTPAIGARCCRENYWDPQGQPNRRAAMERFSRLPRERRRSIFEVAMDAGLDAEQITDATERERWKQAMRLITQGEAGVPGENPDLNPFMLAGESGGVFRGGADRDFGGLNSSALGYFQFLSQKFVPIGTILVPAECDFGHWRRYGPFPDDYAQQTDPVCQVRQFIRAIRQSAKHHGDPMSVVAEKRSGDHTWGP